MTDPDSIAATIGQYERHGWVLRKASLSQDRLSQLRSSHPSADLSEGSHEFLWFSRRSLPDREAWEIRRLSGSPFALVAVIEDSASDEERNAILRETERRMFDGSHPEPTSH